MNIWGLCSRNCLREKDTPLTTPTTGLAGRLWVTDHILHVSNFTCLTAELNSLLFPSAHTGGVCPYRLWSICSHEREPSSQRPTLTAPTNQKPGTSGWAMGTRPCHAVVQWMDPWCITAWNSLYSLYDDLFAKQSLCACSDNRMCYASILLNICVYLNAGKLVLRHQGKFIPVIFAFVFLDLLCALDIVDKLLASV